MEASRKSRVGPKEIGRSGEIRTLDPQHPMLMRYQAALRSDRGISGEAADHTDVAHLAQCGARNAPGLGSGLAKTSEEGVEHLAGREQLLRRGFQLGPA